jgi:N-acetylglucosaminyldiphosphoundecaprenol N-acetyl-beta-D-mannosaminyltransferase
MPADQHPVADQQAVAKPPTVRVGAVEIALLREDEVGELMSRGWETGTGGWIVTANVDIVRAATRDAELAELIAKADCAVADGMPVVWAGRLAGASVPERVTGAALVHSLCARAAEAGRSVFLLGGDPGIPEAAADVLTGENPELTVVGTSSPAFGFEFDDAALRRVIDDILLAHPDLVLVALGFPKQERLIERLRAVLPQAWFLGCGAGLPMAAGQFSRAPEALQRAGGEWLYRLALEPRRLARRYLRDDAPFALRLLGGALVRRIRH